MEGTPTPQGDEGEQYELSTPQEDDDFDVLVKEYEAESFEDDYQDDDYVIPKEMKHCFSLAEDWESNKENGNARRKKGNKHPKVKKKYVNGPRYNKLCERKRINIDAKNQSKTKNITSISAPSSSSSPHPRASSFKRLSCGLTRQQLEDIQNRELTPEDYELLMLLDETVAKKTLSSSTIDQFPLKILEEADLSSSNVCMICLGDYEKGNAVRTLPCGHFFHGDCIKKWLSQSSVNCPIDGLPLS